MLDEFIGFILFIKYPLVISRICVLHLQRRQVKEAFNEQWIIGKVHSFGDRVFKNKYLFVLGEDRLFKTIKMREHISNDIVFTRDKVDVWVELFNITEPANDAVRGGIVSCDDMVIGVFVEHCSEEHCAKFGKTITIEKSSLSPTVYICWASLSLLDQ